MANEPTGQGTRSMLPDLAGRRPAGGAGGGGGGGGGANIPTGTGDIHLGGVEFDPRRNKYSILEEAQAGYPEEEKERLIGRVKGKGQEQLESARTREQQEANYPYQNWNLAKNNPRGNLNNMSYDSTLRYSRMADMINNQFHYNPGHLGHIGTGLNGVVQQSDTATAERWQPIETQEMRQMRANERLDERARNAQVDLQAKIQAYPQAVQEAMDNAVRQITTYITQMDDQTYRFWIQQVIITEYGRSWQNYFNELWYRFQIEAGLDKSSRIWNTLNDFRPSIQNTLGQILVGGYLSPSYDQYLAEQLIVPIIDRVNSGELTWQEGLMQARLLENSFQNISSNIAADAEEYAYEHGEAKRETNPYSRSYSSEDVLRSMVRSERGSRR